MTRCATRSNIMPAGYGDWAIVARDGGAIMGESGLTKLRENGEVELGYMLRRPYWGRGYALRSRGSGQSVCVRRAAP